MKDILITFCIIEKMKQKNIVYNNKFALILLLLPVLPLVYLCILAYKYGGLYFAGIIAAGGLILSLLRLMITRRYKVAGIIINLVLCGLLLFVDIYGSRISKTTGKIVKDFDIYTVDIVKRSDSDLTKESDFFGKSIGYMDSEEYYYNWRFNLLQNDGIYDSLHKEAYSTYESLFDALRNGHIDLAVLSNIAESELNRMIEENQTASLDYTILYHDLQVQKLKELTEVSIKEEGFTILIQAVDKSGYALTDVNMLVTVNPSTGKINMQMIPRDSYVYIAGTGNKYSKVNVAYAYGGMDCAIRTIEIFLKDEIEVNYYARINMKGFMNLVDSLGGITIDNPTTFWIWGKRYDSGKIYISTGEEALTIARARKGINENDIGRGRNQMLIVMGILNKFLENPTLDRMNKILDNLEGNFVTTFKEKDFITLFDILMRIKNKMKIETNTMNGEIFFKDDDDIWHIYQGYFSYTDEEKDTVIKRIKNTLEGK